MLDETLKDGESVSYFKEFENKWKLIFNDIKDEEIVKQYLEEAKDFFEQVINLYGTARVRNNHQILLHEFARIFSRTVRRFYSSINCAENVYTDLVKDELRILIELMFQAFFLLRSPKAAETALDAINLSGISWARAGDKFFKGTLRPHHNEEDNKVMELVRQEIFTKYEGRIPKFYADMSVAALAKKAGLIRVYSLSYNWLSAHLHNEPTSELNSLLQREAGIELPILPPKEDVEEIWNIFSVQTQVFLLTALGSLSGLAAVDKNLATKLLRSFSKRYSNNGWEEEVRTICNNWTITI